MSPAISTITFDWQGVTLSVTYDRRFPGHAVMPSHLSIHVVAPAGTALPITKTGYRSHFVPDTEVEAAGGARAYVTEWLDAEAGMPEWRCQIEKARQTSLF